MVSPGTPPRSSDWRRLPAIKTHELRKDCRGGGWPDGSGGGECGEAPRKWKPKWGRNCGEEIHKQLKAKINPAFYCTSGTELYCAVVTQLKSHISHRAGVCVLPQSSSFTTTRRSGGGRGVLTVCPFGKSRQQDVVQLLSSLQLTDWPAVVVSCGEDLSGIRKTPRIRPRRLTCCSAHNH